MSELWTQEGNWIITGKDSMTQVENPGIANSLIYKHNTALDTVCAENDRLRALCDSYEVQIATVRAERAEVALELARTYTDTDVAPCPLCRYEEGVLVEMCSMHRQIVMLHQRCADYEVALQRLEHE